MAINFTDSPANGATQVIGGRTYTYNSAKNKWDTTATEVVGPTATVYATVDNLPGSATTGDQAFVSGTNRLYIWNGSGWYNIALINTNPTISGVSSSYDLATDGTATVITITATDPEGLPITYSLLSDTSGNIATVTQGTGASSNVFTVTPSTSDANAGSFTLTFRASDGVNIASSSASFELTFTVVNSNYTTALITSVGANNAVNNSFVDSSTNSHTITAAGNATQTTFSPHRHGGYSLYFDGATVMDLGFSTLNSGNWTFECWVICEQGETIVGKYNGGNQLEAFGISNTTGYMYTHTSVGIETPTCVTDLRDGQWHYCVWERYNGTYYYWADGSLEASFANTEAPSGGGNWGMGGVASGRFKGYVKEARLSLSTAVYSGNAPTTPTEPQTTSNGTDAFFTGVGVEIKDYSSNNRTFTLNTTKSAPRTPYDYVKYTASNNGGSMYFDGTGDYLAIPDDADFDFGTDPFTIEAWINIDTTRGNYDRIVAGGTQADGANNHWFVGFWPGAQINLGYYNGSGYTETQFNVGSMPNELWHHVAIVRNGANIDCYFNGVSKGTWNIGASTAWNTGAQGLIVGSRYSNGSPIEPYHGHIGDLRIVKGTAVYTSAFTPPTTALTSISGTSLLLSGTNAGIIDKSQTATSVELFGDTKSATDQTKYLSSSIYFDGNGDYLKLPSSGNFLAQGAWTQEMWLRLAGTGAGQQIGPAFGGGAGAWNSSNGHQWLLFTHGSGFLVQYYGTNNSHNTITIASSAPFTANTWHHWAISWDGTTLRFFLDGTLEHSTTSFTPNTMTSTHTELGRMPDNSYYSQAHYSDVRITKGLARYTSNFTPPAAALQG